MDLWSELKSCLLAVHRTCVACREMKEVLKVQAPLTDLFIKMVGFVSQQNQLGPDGVAQWLNLMCLIVKVYHSLCVQDIPEYFEVTFISKIFEKEAFDLFILYHPSNYLIPDFSAITAKFLKFLSFLKYKLASSGYF